MLGNSKSRIRIMEAILSQSWAHPPRVEVRLKEELLRFQSELEFVRTSYDSNLFRGKDIARGSIQGDLKRYSFLRDSESSSDGSDWEDDVPGHGVDARRLEHAAAHYTGPEEHHYIQVQSAVPQIDSEVMRPVPEIYAPNDPPSCQRPRQSTEVQDGLSAAQVMTQKLPEDHGRKLRQEDRQSSLPDAAKMRNLNPNPNPKRQGSTEDSPQQSTFAVAEDLGEEHTLDRFAEEIGDIDRERGGPAKEMALKIQELLEGHASKREMQDLSWLLSFSNSIALDGQPLAPSQDGQHLESADQPLRSHLLEASADATPKTSRDAHGPSKQGSKEAQAYLEKVLAALAPAQRLTALPPAQTKNPASSRQSFVAQPGHEASLEGEHRENQVSRKEAGGQEPSDNLHTGLDLLSSQPQKQNAQAVTASSPEDRREAVASKQQKREVQSQPPPNGVNVKGPLQVGTSLDPELLAGRVAGQADQSGAQAGSAALEDSNEAKQAIELQSEASRILSQSGGEISEPAPRSKLVVVPSLRGGAVRKPALTVPSRLPKQQAREGQSGLGAEPVPVDEARPGIGDGAELESAAGRNKVAVDVKLASGMNGVQWTADPLGEKTPERVPLEMEKRMELLETLQRRTLELEEQKLQHEINMQRRRAELQLQALNADMSATGADGARLEPAQENLAPLGPATFLLARAREAANELSAAVTKLQSVDPAIPSAPASTTTTASPALSQQLATAVTDLKEMLDKKLGEFYAACASFHAASLQGAAKLAQAAQEGQGQGGGARRAAAAHAMARQTAELDSLRKQVRGSHQIALQSPAFRFPRTPVPSKPPSRTRSYSSTASQSSKRGPQDMAAAAAELATGLREFQTEKSLEGAASQWPGLDSAVEEAVKVAEGHGMERQLLYHTAHAKWRDIAAREEERADSAKAAVQALLGNAFDYEAARKELDFITRAAKGVPERARERAKDPAFQAIAYASATQKRATSWTAPESRQLTAQQAEEARFLEGLRLEVDRRIAAAAALSTGMNVGAKRRKVGKPFREKADNGEVGSGELEREGDKPLGQRIVGKENRAFPQQAGVKAPERTVRRAGSRGRDEKPVVLKKVEIAFGHKVDSTSGVRVKQPQARKRKESETAGWVNRMSEPRRAPESPGGERLEDSDRKRGAPPGVPRRSTLRPADMMHRPANAVRWPSPEPRRPIVGQASGALRPRATGVGDFGGFEGKSSPLGRLTALAREAAAGVNYQQLLGGLDEDHLVGSIEDGGNVDVDKAEEAPGFRAAARETDGVPGGSAQLEETARELTEWLSEQVLSQLIQQPNILNGLRSSPSERPSERNDGAVAGGHGPRGTPVEGASDDVSIDEELVRALAAEVISEEVERLWPQNGKGETAVQAVTEERQAPVALEREEQIELVSELKRTAQQEPEQLGDAWGRQESGLDVPVAGRAVSPALPSSAEGETKHSPVVNRVVNPPSTSQANSANEAERSKPSYSAAQPSVPSAAPGVSQLPSPPLALGVHGENPISMLAQPFPFFPGANAAAGLQSMFGPNHPWPFIPFPLYYLPDGRVFPGAQFPIPPNPVPENQPQKQTAHAQTEPQTSLRPIAVKPIFHKRGGGSPATPPTPSTPSSSPEVTLVSRRRARRGFEAALEGMGISVRLAAEVEPESRPTRPGGFGGGEEVTGGAREVDAGKSEGREMVERGSASTHSSEVQAGRRGLDQETANEQDGVVKEAEASAAEDLKSVLPRGQDAGNTQGVLPTAADSADIAAGQREQGSTEQPLPPDPEGATSAPGAEQSPGSRIRRKWAFLDERWDARQAIDGMTRSLLMEAEEESSSRSGGVISGSGRGRASASESTSLSFGEVVAELASEPSSTLSRLPFDEAAAKAPEGARKDAAATSSMSEGEAEPGDLRQDQELGQRARMVPPELSTDSESGLIQLQPGLNANARGKFFGRRNQQQGTSDSSSDLDAARIGPSGSRRSALGLSDRGIGRSRSQLRRPLPRKDVIRNAVATLRGLARARPEGEVSEGEMESGAEEGEVGREVKEAGQLS